MVDVFSILHLSLNGNQRGEDENVAGMKCSFLEVPKVNVCFTNYKYF